jgi:hypothetical protein
VAFDHYGDGDHNCYWCGKPLEWSAICVDHLNEDKSDNRADNLVLACKGCNRHRSLALGFIRRLLPERIDELNRMISAATSR